MKESDGGVKGSEGGVKGSEGEEGLKEGEKVTEGGGEQMTHRESQSYLLSFCSSPITVPRAVLCRGRVANEL